MKYLLNCRSFISLVVLFSFIDNFSMEEEDKQCFEGISIKKLENGDDIDSDEIYFYKSFAFIGINYCSSLFKKLFYPNTDCIDFEIHKDNYYSKNIYYSIGEKKIRLYFKFFSENVQDFLPDLVTNQKLNYDYFFLCFYTNLFNEEDCVNCRLSIHNFLNKTNIPEILNNNNFYFFADRKFLNIKNEDKEYLKITNFSEENFKNLEKYGKVLITNTDKGENLLCKTNEENEIHLNEENANTVEGCWLKIVLRDLNKKMKEEEKNLEKQKEKSDNENKKVEKNNEENEQNCCENICTFIKNCF